MLDLTAIAGTDPTTVYRPRDGIYATDLLIAGLCHFDVFTWLDGHPVDLAGLCLGLGLATRPADVMVTLFSAMNLIEPHAGRLRCTALAREHLVAGSPYFLGPYYASLKERTAVKEMVEVLRTGKPANWGSRKEGSWATAMLDPAFADQFTAAMDCRGVHLGGAIARAVDLGGRRRLLDIAGGSGVYACSLVAHHPGLEATVLERPPVDAVCRRAVTARGFLGTGPGRVAVVAGDMFRDPWPTGHDVHLLSNVLHDWDEPTVRGLLAAAFAALAPGGLLLVHGAHLDADKRGPLPVAAYSVMLMHGCEGRCYSQGELAEWMHAIGFRDARCTPTAADRSVICAHKPIG